jgi:hypothetical protein
MTGGSLPAPGAVERIAVTSVTPAVLDDYVGRYAVTSAVEIVVTRDGNTLRGRATGQPGFRLLPTGPDRFLIEPVRAILRFERDGTGKVNALVTAQRGIEQRAPRVP